MFKRLFVFIKNLFLPKHENISKETSQKDKDVKEEYKYVPKYEAKKELFQEPNQRLERELYHHLRKLKIEHSDLFWNVYVPYDSYDKDKRTEVDLILTSKYGIFVFEVKDYNGIFSGDINEKMWKVSYSNEEVYEVYNPLLQNKTHISCLAKNLNLSQSIFIPVYLFHCLGFDVNLDNKKENIFFDADNYIVTIENFIKLYSQVVLSEEQLLNIGEELWNNMNVCESIKTKHRERVAQKRQNN